MMPVAAGFGVAVSKHVAPAWLLYTELPFAKFEARQVVMLSAQAGPLAVSLTHCNLTLFLLPLSLQWQVSRESYHRLLKQITLTGTRSGTPINHTYS